MFKRFLVPVLAGLSFLPLQAGAWVGYHGGGFVRGPAGGTAAWHRGGWAGGWGYHGGYHGGVAVVHPDYYHAGCWGCGAAAAGAVGLAAGAAIGAAAASNSTTIIQQPVYVATPVVGSTVVTLPGGCSSATVNGVRYYGCGGTYYQPSFGSNGVYYTVVPNPF